MRNVKKAGAQKGDFLNAKFELYISNLLKFRLSVLKHFFLSPYLKQKYHTKEHQNYV